MKRSIILSTLTLCGTVVSAQCTSAVPANAIVVTSTSAGVISTGGVNFWVCNTASKQVFTGNNCNFWVDGAPIISISGSGNTIRYKGNIQLPIFGSNNTIYAQSAASVANQGSNNTINECGTNGVVFTYASAPSNGCAVVGIEEASMSGVEIRLDAINGALVILPGSRQVQRVVIHDVRGRTVGGVAGPSVTTADLSTLAPGVYVAILETERGSSYYRFVRE